MTKKFTSAEERLSALSSNQAKLLKLLITKKSEQAEGIESCDRDESSGGVRLPTSWGQRRLWFIDQFEGGGAAYNLSQVVRLQGKLSQQALQWSLESLMQRHEALRTTFISIEGEPHQEIASAGKWPLRVVDLSGCGEARRGEEIIRHQVNEAESNFDLQRGPVVRGTLLRLHPDEHLLLLTMHHIVSDGWSRAILMRELAELYTAYVHGQPSSLEPLRIQYGDYAQWQRQRLRAELLGKQLGFWRARLAGAAFELELPTDRPRPPVQRHHGQSLPVTLDVQLATELNVHARRYGITLFMALYAAWAILLSKLSGQEDIVVGTPIANRPRPELEGLVGFFVNTLVLRVQVSGHATVSEFLEKIKETTLSAYEHQEMPFEHVVEALRPRRSLSRHPIFQVMFALQNAPQEALHLPELTVTTEDVIDKTSKFDLLLSLEQQGDEIVGTLNYDTDLFDRETIERWIACFKVLLNAIASSQQPRRIAELPVLPESEYRQLTEVFNATDAAYPQDKLVHKLFEDQVRRTPEAIAIVSDGELLTYRQVNVRANQLAKYLRMRGLGVGEYVPIAMSRSSAMVITQIAVLKCGGVYLPLDPELPSERRTFIINDCGASRLVADFGRPADFRMQPVQWINYAAIVQEVDDLAGDDLQLRMVQVPPAYVMYTSGSTGLPKGVIVPHHAINRLVINNGYARIGGEDCIPHHSNPAFDASTFEIWGALLNGARMVVVPQSVVLDPTRFAELLVQCRATLLWMSVGLFNQYTEALSLAFPILRYLLTGGDSLEPNAIRRVLQNSSPQNLLNAYGPTECTTFSTTHRIEEVEEGAKSIPIGRPIANARIYILDAYRRVVPMGVTGEIYIGGAGVAWGYLNRPELTAERFVADAFSADPGARLYKSGDLARWRQDGSIEFLGRADLQVKLRGFRIELGEIEAHLARHPRVRQNAVMVHEGQQGDKRLVAYLVLHDLSVESNATDTEELRAHLRATLPEYMVPSAFIILEQIPLTLNGKVDRRALPVLDLSAESISNYEAPEGSSERVLAGLWSEQLRLERVGRNDNFFDIGGHSLLAVNVLFNLNRRFGSSLRITDLYENPTVRLMAMRIDRGAIEDAFVDLTKEVTLDPSIVASAGSLCAPPRAVLLTGATGFVGRFVLAQLLEDCGATIYCLVRESNQQSASARLKRTLIKWDLWRGAHESRIVAVPGDLRQPRLGVGEAVFERLCHEIDAIYHCATSMNHLETYAMAKAANVKSVQELLTLATRHRIKLINNISTLSVFSSLTTNTPRVVDEMTCIDHERQPTRAGYAASKWVAEKIFMMASRRGVPCNIFRLGLVWADSQRGRYDELQRDYRIFKSCLLSGYGIENYRYETPPTSVDYVAKAIVYLANRHSGGRGIFHLSSSGAPIERVFERCNQVAGTSLKIVPYYQWIQKLKQLHEEGRSLPALPLIEYAFSMDKEAFDRIREAPGEVHVDCVRTHLELEAGGIRVPMIDDESFRRYIDGISFELRSDGNPPTVDEERLVIESRLSVGSDRRRGMRT